VDWTTDRGKALEWTTGQTKVDHGLELTVDRSSPLSGPWTGPRKGAGVDYRTGVVSGLECKMNCSGP